MSQAVPNQVTPDARAIWAAGNYDVIAEHILDLGEHVVERVGIAPGEEVLDVACGTGNAAIPAARTGAHVVGLDITPELLDQGQVRAAAAGVDVEWVVGDAQALAYPEASFDVVVSTVGNMFAPDHEASARELARVLRPNGRMGLVNWTPEGAIGRLFKTVGAHKPPPAGAQSPALWGKEDHVRELLEPHGVELEFERRMTTWRFASVDEGVDTFATWYGPVIKAREALEPDGRWQALRDDIHALFERLNATGSTEVEFEAEYLLVLGRKR